MKRGVGCLEISWPCFLLPNEPCVSSGDSYMDTSKVQLSKVIVHSTRVNALLPCYRLLISNFRFSSANPQPSFPRHTPQVPVLNRHQSSSCGTKNDNQNMFPNKYVNKNPFIAPAASAPRFFSFEIGSPILSALGGSLDRIEQRQACRGRTTHNLGLLSILLHLSGKKALVTQDTSHKITFTIITLISPVML